MSQQDILNLMEKNKKVWYSHKELMDIFKIGNSSINRNLNKLLKKDIKKKKFEHKNVSRGYIFKYKIK